MDTDVGLSSKYARRGPFSMDVLYILDDLRHAEIWVSRPFALALSPIVSFYLFGGFHFFREVTGPRLRGVQRHYGWRKRRIHTICDIDNLLLYYLIFLDWVQFSEVRWSTVH